MLRLKKDFDMTSGPFLKKIVSFIIPLILTGLLQCFYNAADLAVVGQFRGDVALAAVGSTASLTNLIVALFMGLSVGSGVVVANFTGAKDSRAVSRTVHTSYLLSIILGIASSIIGIAVAPALLRWMDTPETVIEYSILYIRIVFLGMPALMVYNYAASMVRSVGDSTRPLIFLAISGIVNVGLNIVFVVFFGMGVEGVAIATIVSQYLAAVMISVYLMRTEGDLRLKIKEISFDVHIIKRILYIGVPSGIQSALFSFSNVMLQSAINSLGDAVMAGSSASSSLENFVYIAMNSVYQAAIAFVGQNVGAGKYENIKKVMLNCFLCVSAIGLFSAGFLLIFREFFLGIYIKDSPAALLAGLERFYIVLPFYFLCGVMEVFSGGLRSMGKSVSAMIVSLVFACGLRIVWVKTVFVIFPTVTALYLSYPISWGLASLCHLVILITTYKKLIKQKEKQIKI